VPLCLGLCGGVSLRDCLGLLRKRRLLSEETLQVFDRNAVFRTVYRYDDLVLVVCDLALGLIVLALFLFAFLAVFAVLLMLLAVLLLDLFSAGLFGNSLSAAGRLLLLLGLLLGAGLRQSTASVAVQRRHQGQLLARQ
jgi:hypothetical protein